MITSSTSQPLSPENGTLVAGNNTITINDLDLAIGGYLIDFDETPVLRYVPNENYNGLDAFNWLALDQEIQPGDLNISAQVEIQVLPVEDAPIITAPSSITASEDDTLRFSETKRISFNDPDTDADSLTIELQVAEGLLTFTNADIISSIRFLEGDGEADQLLRFRGTEADINAALPSLQYISRKDLAVPICS